MLESESANSVRHSAVRVGSGDEALPLGMACRAVDVQMMLATAKPSTLLTPAQAVENPRYARPTPSAVVTSD